MAGTLSISHTFKYTNTAGNIVFNRTISDTRSTDDLTKIAENVPVAVSNTTVTLLDLTDTTDSALLTPSGGSAGFDYVVVVCEDGEDAADITFIEVTTDAAADNGDEFLVFELRKGDVFVIPREGSMANYTVNFGTVTIDNIERIRAHNRSTGTVAKFSIYAVN